MKPNNDYSFVDLAKLGRTDWRATALTVLVVASFGVPGRLGVLMVSGWSLYFENFHIASTAISLFTDAGSPIGVVGLWIACRVILRRPFLSLISVDLRLSVLRCFLGAALYLPAFVFAIMVASLYTSVRIGSWTILFGHIQSLQGSLIFSRIPGMLAAGLGIALLAFSEELFFRGWLTQTLGLYVRFPAVLAAIVAIIFAFYHTQYDLIQKTTIFFCSIGFSTLSLRDQRLELAVGAHTMMNICVTLIPIRLIHSPAPASALPVNFGNNPTLIIDVFVFAMLKGILPVALMYWFLQKTDGWSRRGAGITVNPVTRRT